MVLTIQITKENVNNRKINASKEAIKLGTAPVNTLKKPRATASIASARSIDDKPENEELNP